MRQEFGVSTRNGDTWRFQPKMKEASSFEGGFSCFGDTPHREGIGAGYLEGRGISSGSVKVTGRPLS